MISAFHDMSTYSEGVGGLDASLQFELDRPENVGSGFIDTFGILSNTGGGHRSSTCLLLCAFLELIVRFYVVSDLLAMAYAVVCSPMHMSSLTVSSSSVVIVTKMCMGPSVPFRAGRIDATEGGGTGVPEPQQDIATHTADFERMGFTATEMISAHAIRYARNISTICSLSRY